MGHGGGTGDPEGDSPRLSETTAECLRTEDQHGRILPLGGLRWGEDGESVLENISLSLSLTLCNPHPNHSPNPNPNPNKGG